MLPLLRDVTADTLATIQNFDQSLTKTQKPQIGALQFSGIGCIKISMENFIVWDDTLLLSMKLNCLG